jgi:hypothetical protein
MVSIAGSEDFPNLKVSDFEETSCKTPDYNCVAWAAGVNDEWWEPSADGVWPSDVPRDITLDSIVTLYSRFGYEICGDGEHEPGFEKIAVYGERFEYEHAARQLPNGDWTSKLGAGVDISHKSLDCIAGGAYGDVIAFLRRLLRTSENQKTESEPV